MTGAWHRLQASPWNGGAAFLAFGIVHWPGHWLMVELRAAVPESIPGAFGYYVGLVSVVCHSGASCLG